MSNTMIITDEFIQNVCEKIRKNKPIRMNLPGWGRVHIDRQLPFLCLYRLPTNRADVGTQKLVLSEASYIIADEALTGNGLGKLVEAIVKTISEECGAFLLIEIWSMCLPEEENKISSQNHKEAFTIVSKKRGLLTPEIETMKNRLSRIKIDDLTASVSIKYTTTIAPQEMQPIIDTRSLNGTSSYMLGLAIRPIYQDQEGVQLYPYELLKLQQCVSEALKKTFFTFVKKHTTAVTSDYRELGRKGVTKSVFKIDDAMAKIEDSFDFLLQVSPVNSKEAWEQFQTSDFKETPIFYYRPRPFDSAIVKRELFKIPIEKIEDPVLSEIFVQKRDEIDRKLTMLNDRGNASFLHGSMQVYGGVEKDLLETSIEILKAISNIKPNKKPKEMADAVEFARAAKEEIAYYKQICPTVDAKVEIRDDIASDAMVSGGNFLIYRWSSFPKDRIEPLIHHEIGTHVLTYFNGLSQPFKQLHTGLRGYDEMQEGIAVLSEYMCGGLTLNRIKVLAGRVIAVHAMIEGATFVDTFHLLKEEYGFLPKTAFSVTTRVFRGGGLTKDAVYLRGFLQIFDYLKAGGKLDLLFVGKIAANHIPIIQELLYRKVLHKPPLSPRYLEDAEALKRLEMIRNGHTLLDIINKEMT
ncbi:flavohemoglobin expression-modulating QEGLA motif protein [Sulfurovum sp.]|uniref:flavohemoglobin expression-modulating QEGLA motif protein n=1 Tax=Sulfurovum sp. TaxID=1969726 RepID=UPI002867F765|nr:flavohemoglobin expression-modulating QEGLA motif protein [Sulfurovum sp.]